jgi:adenylate cyclase
MWEFSVVQITCLIYDYIYPNVEGVIIMEIERKFLLNKDTIPDLSSFRKYIIEQGYLSMDPEIRIRKAKEAETETCFLTTKSEGELVRDEFEVKIDVDLYNRLSGCIISQLIIKERYYSNLAGIVPCKEKNFNNLKLEIDVYRGRQVGLVVAEIEFEDEITAKSFIPPVWFGEEVTFNKMYRNKNLAFG